MNKRISLTLGIMFGIISISLVFNQIGFFEPSPKNGQIWVPSFVDAQPNWPDFWDTEIIDVKDGYVRIHHKGIYENYSLLKFHCRYNYQREK